MSIPPMVVERLLIRAGSKPRLIFKIGIATTIFFKEIGFKIGLLIYLCVELELGYFSFNYQVWNPG
jgi:hypothetical protein